MGVILTTYVRPGMILQVPRFFLMQQLGTPEVAMTSPFEIAWRCSCFANIKSLGTPPKPSDQTIATSHDLTPKVADEGNSVYFREIQVCETL